MDKNRFFEEKEIIWISKIHWRCPTCGTWGMFPLSKDTQPKYCYMCGQKIKFPIKKEGSNNEN